MSDETYNGWTNKATWLVKLWIDNDQGEQEFWLGQAREYADAGYANTLLTQELAARYALAGALSQTYEEQVQVTGFWADLMNWALAMVNWDEIAKSLIEDAAEVLA